MSEKIRVAVGMSGGVDSSVTALLLKKEGYEVIGLTMNIALTPHERYEVCCSWSSINDAMRVAHSLGIPHFVINLKKEFEERIIKYFIDSYINGYTPNPCVFCNRLIKFDLLLKKAQELGAEYLATGHYVRKVWDPLRNVFLLKRAKDMKKDQSYFLSFLTQEQISKALFPLGDLTKEEVRRIARENGLIVAEKGESQEICFLPDKDYRKFLKQYVKEKSGKIVTEDGKIVGYHDGIFSFTIGQRRGLKVALGKPIYVKDINTESGDVFVAEKEKIYRREVYAINVNYPSFIPEEKEIRVDAMIRYNMKPSPATLHIISEKEVFVVFDEPQWAITPGQILVCYKDDFVLCGGVIERKKY
jgi:tRNA-specific 2-thiouridylase